MVKILIHNDIQNSVEKKLKAHEEFLKLYRDIEDVSEIYREAYRNGYKEGYEEGKKEQLNENILNLLQAGMLSKQQIAEAFSVSVDYIENLLK